MSIRPNSNRVSTNTDKELCKFLLSPFSHHKNGFKNYKIRYNLAFPEHSSRQIPNRLDYLKRLQKTKFIEFAEVCHSYGINTKPKQTDFDTDLDTDSDTAEDSEDYSTPPRKTAFQTPTPSKTMKMATRKFDNDGMRMNSEQLDLENPSLNKFGMMWFRDDDVEIGDSLVSILTIYQPLFDARDFDNISLHLDEDRPNTLHHVHPTVPTFFYQDFSQIHDLEGSKLNPEVYSSTKKKHKKHANKIRRDKTLRLQISEYELPFLLTADGFDGINNSVSVEKHFRTIEVDLDEDEGIVDKCSYIFWKIMIDGETTDCSISKSSTKKQRSAYACAQDRLEDPPGASPPYVGDVVEENNYNESKMDTSDDNATPMPTMSSPSTEIAYQPDNVQSDHQTEKQLVKKLLPQLYNYLAVFQNQDEHSFEENSDDSLIPTKHKSSDDDDDDDANKKPKLNDVKPMDEESQSEGPNELYPDL